MLSAAAHEPIISESSVEQKYKDLFNTNSVNIEQYVNSVYWEITNNIVNLEFILYLNNISGNLLAGALKNMPKINFLSKPPEVIMPYAKLCEFLTINRHLFDGSKQETLRKLCQKIGNALSYKIMKDPKSLLYFEQICSKIREEYFRLLNITPTIENILKIDELPMYNYKRTKEGFPHFFLYGSMAYHKYNNFMKGNGVEIKEIDKSYDYDINFSFDILPKDCVHYDEINKNSMIKTIITEAVSNTESFEVLNHAKYVERNYVNLN